MMDKKAKQDYEFDSDIELYNFIINELGYDDESEIKRLIKNGGDYVSPKLRSMNSNESPEPEDIEFDILVNESEVTAFDDVDLFVKEYRKSLIGSIILIDSKKQKIENIIAQHGKKGNALQINGSKVSTLISESDLQSFVDGEEISDITDSKIKIQLQLQDEVENTSLNENDFKYYVVSNVNDKMRIVQGFEYKEDAKESLTKLMSYGGNVKFSVVSKKDLASVDIDPASNDAWQRDTRDYDIVDIALKQAVARDDFSQEKADGYLEFYKQQKLTQVIKAQLIYLHHELQIQLHRAYIISNIEKINKSHELLKRVESELMNIIKSE